ncbi:MAG TPA: type II toxin-antitoxin system MqsR family toxin [Polyangiaceae bacterium]|jgi:hypothetical protein|nr:type II toxin-antitoxin system MqsR family toxin [Polyangiaceae bacterium]
MAKTPRARFSLEEVKRVIRLAAIGSKVSARTAADYNLALPQAEQFIRNVIAGLEPDAFVEVSPQTYPGKATFDADVYAVNHQEGACYIKFHIVDGRVIVLSCHIPKHPIKRIDGKIIGAS